MTAAHRPVDRGESELARRDRATRLADARTFAGYRQAHFAQTTGTLVVVVDGEAAGLDVEGGRWSTVCDDHGTVIAHDTLALAKSHAADPAGWCEECQEVEKGAAIAEGVRIMGFRDGRYDLDNAADTGLVSDPALGKVYREAYAEGAAARVDVTAEEGDR